MTQQQSIIIIGGGLSGLHSAWRLQNTYDVKILEARPTIGGRILSRQISNLVTSQVDLGPAWVWPQLQPRLCQLIQTLNLSTFKQFTSGDMLYEQLPGGTQRHSGQSSHDQSYRVCGGAQSLINKISAELKDNTIQTDTRVHSIDQTNLSILASHQQNQLSFSADKIIIALPPRLLEQNIQFTPTVANDISALWKSNATWMAGHCKIVFIYEHAFWRENNLSAEVFSHIGPMSEIYDGSPENEDYYALTAFIGLNAQQRAKLGEDQLITLCKAQLERLFGAASQTILSVQIKDWSLDEFTTSKLDLNTAAQHPYYPEDAPRSLANGNIILSGTEMAQQHAGYLEGALDSSEQTIKLINEQSS